MAASPRWTPEAQIRARAAWVDVKKAAALEGHPSTLLAAVAVQETEFSPVRGGLDNNMWGVGQVYCDIWLRPLREKYGRGLTCDDLLSVSWGLVASAYALRVSIQIADGNIDKALCVYSHGMVGLEMSDCAYSREVRSIEAVLVVDLADLLDDT